MLQPVYKRRALLCGLAALAGGAGLGVLAYPRVEWARWWYDVIGVDVSNHQGDIDWSLLARTDIAFAYLKATEGGDFRDRRFQANWDGARKAGLPRGAYHFFTQCRSGADQARNFIGLVPREPGALPPVLDLEDMGTCRSGPQVVNLWSKKSSRPSACWRPTTGAAHFSTSPLSSMPLICEGTSRARGSGRAASSCHPNFEPING